RRGVYRRAVRTRGEGLVDQSPALDLAALLSVAGAVGRVARGPVFARQGAPHAAARAEESFLSPGGVAAGRTRLQHSARIARPDDARDAVCDRVARFGTGRVEAGPGQP